MKIKHVVETFIAYDRPTLILPRDYILFRHRFFHDFTLRSLKNQRARDFDILVQTGMRNIKLMMSLDWDDSLILLTNNAESYYRKIDADIIAITRIDSDDLFRFDAIELVKEATLKIAKTISKRHLRHVFAFKRNIYWDRINRLIGRHIRASTPFFTHVFPGELVRNGFHAFSNLHFRSHGKDGAGDLTADDLAPGRVCVIKHSDYNTSLFKRGMRSVRLTDDERIRLAETEKFIIDPDEIEKILRDFGLDESSFNWRYSK